MRRSNRDSKRSALRGLAAWGLAGTLAAACGTKPSSQQPANPDAHVATAPTAQPLPPSALQTTLAMMQPARPLPPSDAQRRLTTAIDQYFQRTPTQRLYVHVDKPLYQPGEAIWFRIWEFATPTLTKGSASYGITAQLISPKGAAVLQKRIMLQAGLATNDFELPAEVQGGEYTLRATTDTGAMIERKIVVSTYQPPQVKKQLEFLRKAYGPGDNVTAALALHRATGEPLAGKTATAVVTIDEAEVARVPVRTDATGKGVVRFDLPAAIARGDGLLTVLVDEGGVTESIQKRIPILLKELQVELFPEGGDLIANLPGRVYFSAKNLTGKPADIEGRVVDNTGRVVSELRSYHNGMGRFELTPAANVPYFVEVTRPAGITQRIPVPAARAEGCSMIAVDDPPGAQRDDARVAVWCTKEQPVIATAVLRERRLGDVAVDAKIGEPTVVSIPVPMGAQGAVRMTLMNEQLQPLAERLIYRGRGADLDVRITPDRPTYAPRDPVVLTVETRDSAGRPVQADLSLAVVDDSVLSFADDKTAHLLSRIYLESEMPGQEIEEPNFYFSNDPKAPQALDLVLGTQGWRRFEWQWVLTPPQPVPTTASAMPYDDMAAEEAIPMAAPEPEMADKAEAPRAPRARAGMARPAKPAAAPPPPPALGQAMGPARREMAKQKRADMPARDARARRPMGGAGRAAGVVDEDWEGLGEAADQQMWAWAPVRQFPVPNYEARYDGPRVDFRETIFWQPSVPTSAEGKAEVRFYLSDAVTSFKATAEGVSAGGLPGRGEALVQSKLPVSLAVTMPLEVSAGDTVRLPVTLTNETSKNYDVTVSTQFGPAFRVQGGIPGKISLAGGQKQSFFATLRVVGDGKDPDDGTALVAIETSNLRDEMRRTIKVVPLGFPQELSLSGTLERTARHEIDLGGALPGTVEASLNLYPSPLATMVKGTEAIIREPTGCFEQASSANYPNIMVLSYLEQHDAVDPQLIERTMGTLDRGYKKLVGYESPQKGYEWFGGDPGHEALTAYGLMEFADMTKVYGDVDTGMIERTKSWLKSRRDGKGGYQRNARALDSFGRASDEVTNGYITYALTEAGEKDISAELTYQKNIAQETKDPYLMALAANVLVNVEPGAPTTQTALRKLASMQNENGSFPGANHSITRSGGQALLIETTSLAALALIKAGEVHNPPVRNAIRWLDQNRDGFGAYGSTQSTILALRAMTRYADATRATVSGGAVTLKINGREVGKKSFDKGHKDALVFDDIAAALKPGKNVVELVMDGQSALPYSMAVTYRSRMPASSPESAMAVSTRLARTDVPMGEGVRMKVTVKNVTNQGQPMTLARVGLPGGLAFQTWQLKELKDKGVIDFYETQEREVVLYWRSMAPGVTKDVDLDLIARVPGQYVAPASSAYLYYTDEFKNWAEPVQITVK